MFDWLHRLYWGIHYWFSLHLTHCERCGRRGCSHDAVVDFAASLCQSCYEEEMEQYAKTMAKYEKALVEEGCR